MTILHVSPSSPHLRHFMSVVARFAPQVRQVVGDPGVQFGQSLAIVHNCTDYPTMVPEARALAPVVGYVANDLRPPSPELVAACDLLIGDVESKAAEVVPPEKWFGFRPMPWASVFHPPAPGAVRDIPVLVARGWNGHPAYWGQETREALAVMEGVVWVDGKRTPQEMADLYRRARCVVALREDAGPSYSVVEACLCGAVPVVSDTPVMRKHLFEGGEQMAGVVRREPQDIRFEVSWAVNLPPSTQDDYMRRNRRHFASWTAEAQGPALVQRILEVTHATRP